MINFTRRTALKYFSATIVASGAAKIATAAVPTQAATAYAQQARSIDASPDVDGNDITDVVISLEKSDIGSHAFVTVSNTSSKATTIRHIRPGIVSAEGHTYDLNGLVQDGPLTLAAGDSIRLPVVPVTAVALQAARMSPSKVPVFDAAETPVPTGLTRGKPVVVKTRLAGSPQMDSVRTVRTAFA